MIYPLVLEFAADGIPVAVTCRVLGFSKQAFYQWRVNPVSDRDWADAHLINAAYDIHNDDPTFGYRFIADELPAKGIRAGENRVARLCSQQRIWSLHAKKRGLNRKPGAPVHDDLINRRFVANRPNREMANRHHRTPHRRRQALPLRDPRRLLRQGRRLFHALPDEGRARRLGAAQRHRPPRPSRHHCALGQG
jgi:putative transposase